MSNEDFSKEDARECILELKKEIIQRKNDIKTAVSLIYDLVTEFRLQDMLGEE